MSLADKALEKFFPEQVGTKKVSLVYSGRFRGYNANVRHSRDVLSFALAKAWKEVDEEIQMGLIHHLLLKALHKKGQSVNIELYNSFIRSVGKYIQAEEQDENLLALFHKINDEYFEGLLDAPNLIWGGRAFRILGHYDYGTNAITISEVMRDGGLLLEYVLYHEMLHMKFRYELKGARAVHHSKTFRVWEKRFKLERAEDKLKSYLMSKKWRERIGF
ncbi:MAG: SprT-like domain-containing protein [Candidatus Woesearchaeota archaeon]